MKKRIYWILTAMLLVLGACTSELPIGQQDAEVASTDEIEVNLNVEVAPQTDEGGDTRSSYVTGEDAPSITASTPVLLLCFDVLYVTNRAGTFVPTDNTSGKLKGKVPSNTARIHFLFNYPAGINIATAPESVLMQHESMSVGVNDAMSYWGYHKETNASSMATWLTSGTSTLKLLRDRAQLKVANGDPDIASIQWTVSNGLSRGLMAPKAAGNTSEVSYPNSYTTDADIQVSQFLDGGFYNLTQPAGTDVASYLAAGWTTAGSYASNEDDRWSDAGESQYLMENRNVRYPVKLVLRVTFNDNAVKFYTFKLLDDHYRPINIRRNHRYLIKVNGIEKAAGYDTADEALASNSFANDQYANIGNTVIELDDGVNTLSLNSTSEMVMNVANTSHTISFRYRTNSTGSGVSTGNVVAFWMDKDITDNTHEAAQNINVDPTVTYDTADGNGSVTFDLAAVQNNVMKHSTLRLVCTDTGLYRDIEIYSVGYNFSPTLVDVGSNKYTLTFSLPPMLPREFFPVTVRMTSWTLQPPNSLDYDPTKHTRVSVYSTNVPPISTDNTSTAKRWNYQAESWNKWYECPIDYADPQPASYTITLDDVRSSIATANQPTNVGLYIQLVNMSDLIAVTP